MRRSSLLLPFLTLALACTSDTLDGPDLTGVWRVTAHTDNATGCTPGDAATDPPYIQFSVEKFFGVEAYVWVSCTSPTACDQPGLFDLPYAKPIAGGYQGEAYVASGDATACTLAATQSTVVQAADGSVTIETRVLTKDGVTGTPCQADEAQAALNAGQLTCGSLEVMTAVRQ